MTAILEPTRVVGVLPAAQPFDLRTSIRFLKGFGACRGDQVMTVDSLTKAIAVDGQAIAFKVASRKGGVDYVLHSDEPISPATREVVCHKIDGYLSLSDDLAEFYALAETDHPAYARLVRNLWGLHQVRFLTVAEIGVWAVLSQRTPKNISTSLKRRITQMFGRKVTFEGAEYQAFPELTDLVHLTAADWVGIVKNGRKAEYLASLVDGLLDIGEDYLATAPYDEATKALRRIKGIGEFSAAAILLRGLGRMDFVPLDMPNFAEATAKIYGEGYDNQKLRDRYGKHLGYWAYYLHTALGALKEEALA
ncbi:DNA-3-methyladenine glycosylase [Kutzneria buriramensis]|uniref:DNA-(apurinic or apyrimidinic site) lyase n=1 Tax=Kutzneria buriramensis TaxID=1045776 RepID=A0A3E0H4C4_9PSEU|nr:DNA-3-methyladenine glycosylase [Kutzneria buriramensis]REH38088.1 DNA-3-methyladenine glycosylase II [Kutzneria buriramensis]